MVNVNKVHVHQTTIQCPFIQQLIYFLLSLCHLICLIF